MIHGAESSARHETSGDPQGTVLCVVLFNIFISNLEEGIERTLNKFVDDTKLGGMSDILESCATIQQHINKLEN